MGQWTLEDIDEILDIISYNLSYNISAEETIKILNITDPYLIATLLSYKTEK